VVLYLIHIGERTSSGIYIDQIIVKGLESFAEGYRWSYRSVWTLSKEKCFVMQSVGIEWFQRIRIRFSRLQPSLSDKEPYTEQRS